ncbi:hypothetical protein GWI33_008238 [Rhynchophorus ferrugineus]|uniref:Reverse transcriptase domain-containing protein n=1 Tax=Rhynchophorus ferrugineus TaxID=354439 RepID=A0A834MHG9_RHYFE|nr:hypothetical protein GWI33_008238 [Rhynchophorus ferrugineus]
MEHNFPDIETGNSTIELVTPKELTKVIKTDINPRKSPGYDLITGELLQKLPRKAIIKLTNLINTAFRLCFNVPDIWKMAEIIMIPKHGKSANKIKANIPISLPPVLYKVSEKLLLKRIKPIIERKNLIPTHQITDVTEKAYENKKVCSAIFLDVAQAFDKVWHEGLVHKRQKMLPKQDTELLKLYITTRMFRVKQEEAYSTIKEAKAGVPQGSVLGPMLYLLYTCNIPQKENITMATFVDHSAIIAVGDNSEEASRKLQQASDNINNRAQAWKIRINETTTLNISE